MKLVAFAALATLALSTSAQAAANRVTYRDQYAYGGAYAASVDANGCETYTYLSADAYSQMYGQGANATSYAGAWISMDTYNYCTGAWEWGYAYLNNVQLGRNLSGGTIEGDVTLWGWTYDPNTWEYSSSERTVHASVVLTGSGATQRGMSINSQHGAWGHSISRSVGSNRDAVVGITVDGVTLDASSAWGYLGSATSGSLSVYHR